MFLSPCPRLSSPTCPASPTPEDVWPCCSVLHTSQDLSAAPFCSPSPVTLLNSQLNCDSRGICGQQLSKVRRQVLGYLLYMLRLQKTKLSSAQLPHRVYCGHGRESSPGPGVGQLPRDLQGPPHPRPRIFQNHKAMGTRFWFQALLFPEVVLCSFLGISKVKDFF